jgi:hypothetical protein
MKLTGGGGGGVNEQQSPRAVAHYIAALTGELARLARGHRMDGLAYILDMAQMEAEQIAKSSANSSGRAA